MPSHSTVESYSHATPYSLPARTSDGGPPPDGPKFPWCAQYRGNGLLYSSRYDGASVLRAYDPMNGFRHVPGASIPLSETLEGVQGGCFDERGNVYLSMAERAEVLGFSAFTGRRLGSVPFEMHPGFHELAEGICWAPLTIDDKLCGLHLILLDRDVPFDDIFIKHIATGTVWS